MTPENVTVILAVIAAVMTWTATVIGVTLWINSKFNSHERLVFIENTKTREMLRKILEQHAGRIMRLELHNYGSTLSDDFIDHRDHRDEGVS